MGNHSSPTPLSSSQESSTITRIRDFLRMNPPVFTGSKVEENPHNFIDEIWKILKEMHITEIEGVELVSYQLKDVANVWYDQWEQSHREDAGPTVWDKFESAFLDHFFPQELWKTKVEEFLNLKKESMTVKEYSLKFIQLSKYALEIIPHMMSKMRKFVSGLGKYNECPSKRQGDRGSRALFSSTTPQNRGNQRDASSGACRGTNSLYAMGSRQD
ncbi:uncharacterized protein LOC129894676 [Solanum dulcamara]|uniref:uncharacterized protein LOC129894676 n=1 Tax=Solanum dulcamara TaxID=45834 RepID=UPI002485FD78|nr:uncharacterized protein LOC129894676 [Solanum dulcamara]